jgi:hypothetical protein
MVYFQTETDESGVGSGTYGREQRICLTGFGREN